MNSYIEFINDFISHEFIYGYFDMNSLRNEFIYEYNIMNSGHMNSYMNTLYELVAYQITYMNSKKNHDFIL